MRVTFEGSPSKIKKEMQEFINQLNVEPDETMVVEATGDRNNWVSVKDLKARCNELDVNYRKLRYDLNLVDTRINYNGKQLRAIRGIKLLDK